MDFFLVIAALLVTAFVLRGLKQRYPSPRELRRRDEQDAARESKPPIGSNWHGGAADPRDQPDLVLDDDSAQD